MIARVSLWEHEQLPAEPADDEALAAVLVRANFDQFGMIQRNPPLMSSGSEVSSNAGMVTVTGDGEGACHRLDLICFK